MVDVWLYTKNNYFEIDLNAFKKNIKFISKNYN